MKVLMINGSPDPKGCIATALKLAAETLSEQGVETETMQIGRKVIRGCIACGSCRKLGRCVFDDEVNEAAQKLREADGGRPSPEETQCLFSEELIERTVRRRIGDRTEFSGRKYHFSVALKQQSSGLVFDLYVYVYPAAAVLDMFIGDDSGSPEYVVESTLSSVLEVELPQESLVACEVVEQ